MLALGILLTVINVVRSLKKGAIAGPDPWKAQHARVVHALAAAGEQLRRRPARALGRADEGHPPPDRAPDRRAAAVRGRQADGDGVDGGLARHHGRRRLALGGVRQVVADYVTLTKPKVQLLLLLTTVTTMYVAGDPSLGLVALTVLGGSLSAGGAGGGQPLLRPRHRRADGPHGHAAGAGGARLAARGADLRPRARGAVVPAAGDHGQPAGGRSWRSRGFLGYVFVYTIWLKRSTPQNIVIGGAAGRRPAAGRLGGGDRRARPGRAVPVRDRLLLDAAALLGAVAADEGRVRARRRADDAGRPRRGRDAPPDRALHRPARRR